MLQTTERLLLSTTLFLSGLTDLGLYPIKASSWPMQAPLLLVGVKSFYRQFFIGNFYSFEIVSIDCSLMKSHQLKLPFLSSSESSSRDDMVPHLEMLFAT